MDSDRRSRAIRDILLAEREAQEVVEQAQEDVREARRGADEAAQQHSAALKATLEADFNAFQDSLRGEAEEAVAQRIREDQAFVERLTTSSKDKIDECVDILYNMVVQPAEAAK